jgi:hypothetical protein
MTLEEGVFILFAAIVFTWWVVIPVVTLAAFLWRSRR